MAVITLPQRNDDGLQAAIAQIFAQSEARRMERERLAQQQAQFDAEANARRPLAEAQIRGLDAATSAALSGAEDQKNRTSLEQHKAQAAAFLENAYKPLVAAGKLAEAETVRAAVGRANPIVGGWEARPATSLDEANANAARWLADATGRAAAGGQQAIDVNATMKTATGEQLQAAPFANQETREFGQDALRQAVAIGDDRTAGATAQLQAATSRANTAASNATQLQIAREGDANARAIAELKTGGATATPEQETQRQETLALFDDLLTHPGRDSASGVSGYITRNLPATDARAFEAKVNRLKALLTLDNLKLLKGAMSDKDLAFLLSIPAALDLGMKDEDIRKELQRARDIFAGAGGASSDMNDDPLGLFRGVK